MSQFSGKCDIYDSCVMIGKYDIKNITLYIYKNGTRHKISLEEPRDLIPYYPYVPYVSTYNNGKYTIYISENFVDQEERQLLEFDLKCALREYRKAERNKTEFNMDASWYNKDIIQRVKEQGKKATIKGIHKKMSNYYRKQLAEEMEKNGYLDHEIINYIYPERAFTDFDWRKDDY